MAPKLQEILELKRLLGLRKEIPEGANCVAVLADRGDRYLGTIYSDTWVERNMGLNPSQAPKLSALNPTVSSP